jgi:hypothetical protein
MTDSLPYRRRVSDNFYVIEGGSLAERLAASRWNHVAARAAFSGGLGLAHKAKFDYWRGYHDALDSLPKTLTRVPSPMAAEFPEQAEPVGFADDGVLSDILGTLKQILAKLEDFR